MAIDIGGVDMSRHLHHLTIDCGVETIITVKFDGDWCMAKNVVAVGSVLTSGDKSFIVTHVTLECDHTGASRTTVVAFIDKARP